MGGVSEMLLIFFSCMDFFIGIVAYFRFIGIILHILFGIKVLAQVFPPMRINRHLYLKGSVCMQEDVRDVYESYHALSLDPEII